MRTLYALIQKSVLALIFVSLLPIFVIAQAVTPQTRITQAVDNTRLTMLRGNTHPLAQSRFDQGAAPDSLLMDHMQLVLKHSAQQETALQQLLADQQNPSSSSYHKWLTPEQFGEQFGVADQDLQTVTAWLQSQGFQIDEVAKGRNVIQFSGNAGQVKQAFHTSIHRYVLANGEEHWANASDPQIPAALTPAVAGVNTLHNFGKSRMSHAVGSFRKTVATGKVTRINPQFTYAGGCNGSNTSNCYAIGPQDFGTIYDVTALWNLGITGSNQTIGIVSDSNINVNDANSFRSLFGLSSNPPKVVLTGANPGVLPCGSPTNGDECEAILDVEWAGAIAPAATIDLVVSPSTNTTFGGDTSAMYIINNNTASILSYSYGDCELALGTTGNQFYNAEWQQAAAEGITVAVSTGDNGSAGCDETGTDNGTAQAAQYGLAVNGLASTAYNVAVGGTDFNDFNNPTTYFSATSGTKSSALSYIPEITYNDTCTNSIIYSFFSFTSAEPACNSSTLANDSLIIVAGGGGGVSNCTINASTNVAQGPVSSCSGGNAKPTWQTGNGVPKDGLRDIPDLSLFAGDGSIQNFYVVCEQDSTNNASCNLNSPYQDFIGEGGTSISTQVFAGVMALINQQAGSRQGNPNPTLYKLAASENFANCNSTSSPAGSCIFYDVTSGTNAMPCGHVNGVASPNCTFTNSNDNIGTLSGYNAGTGYDQATGLGSVNVCNLVEDWTGANASFYIGASSCPASISISSAGSSNSTNLTVTGVNGFTNTVTFACSGLPTGATCTFNPTSVALNTTTTSASVQVTVATTTASVVGPWRWHSPFGSGRRLYALTSLYALCLLAMVIFTLRSTKRRVGIAFASIAVSVILIFAAGCGGGSSSSTGGVTGGSSTTTNATITATSGSVSQSTTFAVTIQ
jgi:subtilase family serine protease